MNHGPALSVSERAIHVVALPMQYQQRFGDFLAKAFPDSVLVYADEKDEQAMRALLHRADVAILSRDASPAVLNSKSLRWIHCNHAGIDQFAPAELFDASRTITTAAGRSAPAIAEHALFFMLALTGQQYRFWLAKRWRCWSIARRGQMQALHGKTVLIVGAGHTAQALAKLCAAHGMNIVGYRRRVAEPVSGIPTMYASDAGDKLKALVGSVDFLLLCASLNDSSHRLVDQTVIDAMQPDSFIVNVARAGLLDASALRAALGEGRLAGAALDVFDAEPLSVFSPMWRCRNLLLTPHTSPPLPDRDWRAMQAIKENAARYRAGLPLRNQMTLRDAYTEPARRRNRIELMLTRLWSRCVRWALR